MADLAQIKSLFTDPTLGDRIEAACVIVAEEIRAEPNSTTNHANRLLWAKGVWTNSSGERDRMLKALLGAYHDLEVAEITGALDTAILAAVRNAVNAFATGS